MAGAGTGGWVLPAGLPLPTDPAVFLQDPRRPQNSA